MVRVINESSNNEINDVVDLLKVNKIPVIKVIYKSNTIKVSSKYLDKASELKREEFPNSDVTITSPL